MELPRRQPGNFEVQLARLPTKHEVAAALPPTSHVRPPARANHLFDLAAAAARAQGSSMRKRTGTYSAASRRNFADSSGATGLM